VDSRYSNSLLSLFALDIEVPRDGKGFVVLGYLVAFVQVRIEIVLPGEHRLVGDGAMEGFCDPQCVLNHLPVENRQRPWQAEAHGTDMRIGAIVPVVCRAPAEEFRARIELAVDLKSHDDIHVCAPCS